MKEFLTIALGASIGFMFLAPQFSDYKTSSAMDTHTSQLNRLLGNAPIIPVERIRNTSRTVDNYFQRSDTLKPVNDGLNRLLCVKDCE